VETHCWFNRCPRKRTIAALKRRWSCLREFLAPSARERSGAGREDRYCVAESATFTHPFSSTKGSIPRLFAAHQRRWRRFSWKRCGRCFRARRNCVFVSSVRSTFPLARAQSLHFIFFFARCTQERAWRKIPARERKREISEARLSENFYSITGERQGMDAPATRIISRVVIV